ncbi:MAG: CNNM domain-containing protein [Planctomycetota bacterium]
MLLGQERKRPTFLILAKAMRDSPALLLSMLIGTNLAHYLATSFVTLLLLSRVRGEHTAEVFATLITAPTLFIFSELIPKNIFFYRADTLMPFFAPVLYVFHKIFTWSGIVPALKRLSTAMARLTGTPLLGHKVIPEVRSSRIKAIFQETHEEGLFSPVQADLINRIVSIPEIHMGSVMTSIGQLVSIDLESDRAALLNALSQCAFTRLPVWTDRSANIIGYVNIYDCLTSEQEFTDLRNFVKPIRRLPVATTVIDAINIMQRENERMVLVTRTGPAGAERAVGIVTMKDLVEELLGELTEW